MVSSIMRSFSKSIDVAWGLLVVGGIAISVVQGLRFLTRDMIDFSVIHRVGERILHGQSIYDFSDGIMLFKYTPIIGYVLTPLAFLPKLQSAFVFYLLSLAAFAGCFRISYQWVMPQDAKGWVPLAVVTLAILSTLRVIMNSLDFGQVQVFILLGMLYAVGVFASRKWLRGGLVLALITLSKILPILLCVPFLVRRQFRPTLATVGISMGLLVAPAFWLGPSRAMDLTRQWWNVLRITTNQSMIERWTNQSLLSALERVFAPNHYYVNWFAWEPRNVIVLTNVILVLWLAGIVWLGYRRDEKRFPSLRFAQALDLSHYLLLIIVAFPLAWRYHFTSMILPNMLVLSYLLVYARRDYLVWGLFGAALLLSSGVNQEILGSRLFEWFHLRSCLTASVFLTLIALVRIDRRYSRSIESEL